ncbi:hypothetical protein Tco_1241097, partial [Tanacetum coccineum]
SRLSALKTITIMPRGCEEIRLRIDGLFGKEKHAIGLTKEFTSLYINGPAGADGISTGHKHKREILLEKGLLLPPEIHLSPAPSDQKIRLYEIAHGRAVDKGNNINFSIIPYIPLDVKCLKIVIIPNWVKRVIAPLLNHPSCPNVDDIETRGVNKHVNVEVYEVRDGAVVTEQFPKLKSEIHEPKIMADLNDDICDEAVNVDSHKDPRLYQRSLSTFSVTAKENVVFCAPSTDHCTSEIKTVSSFVSAIPTQSWSYSQ